MGTLLPWFLSAGFITVKDLRVEARPPFPHEFVASGAAFAALTVLGQARPELASIMAWGLLLALALRAGGPEALAGGTPAPGRRRIPGSGGARGGKKGK